MADAEPETASATLPETLPETLHIDVAVHTPAGLRTARLSLAAGARVSDACAAASRALGLDAESLCPDTGSVGIFGQKVAASEPLVEGDRLEIYRPITCDPKALRRARAAG